MRLYKMSVKSKSSNKRADNINYDRLANTKVNTHPFEYMVITDMINDTSLEGVITDFPRISSRGSFPLDTVKCGPRFLNMIEELKGDKFRKIVEDKFSIDLSDKPIMITARGLCEDRDGQIHVDSKGKLITVLLYMNETWEHSGGRLRILNNQHNLEDYVAEVIPVAGTMIIFKCTDNAWHGHHPFSGRRNAIQLNWVVDSGYLDKERARHKVSAFFKKIKSFFQSL